MVCFRRLRSAQDGGWQNITGFQVATVAHFGESERDKAIINSEFTITITKTTPKKSQKPQHRTKDTTRTLITNNRVDIAQPKYVTNESAQKEA